MVTTTLLSTGFGAWSHYLTQQRFIAHREVFKVLLQHHLVQPIALALLQVQGMTPAARWQWLQDEWGHSQDSGYATLVEKNRFDETRELQRALEMPIRHLAWVGSGKEGF